MENTNTTQTLIGKDKSTYTITDSIKSARHKISDDLYLICHKYGIYLCTATLINITEENPDDNWMAQAEKCIFQPELSDSRAIRIAIFA